jgi:tRNA threonylcarbamoyladenosine biosynthesis protein TsaE
MKNVIIKTEKDTQAFAKNLAKSLKGGEIIALEGDLGAGKTTMTQYIAKAFGVKENVTSPTFVLMKVYEGRRPKSEVRKLVHVDCYRLDDPQELFYLGIEEYMNNKESVVVIEWADKIKDYLKKFKKVIWIKIKLDKDLRKINVSRLGF